METQTEYAEDSSAIYGANAQFIEALYQQYLADPESVEPTWREKFDVLQMAAAAAPTTRGLRAAKGLEESAWAAIGQIPALLKKHEDLVRLIEAFRARGHLAARINPMPLNPPPPAPDLELAHYSFTQADLNQPLRLDGAFAESHLTLAQLVHYLRQTYCGTVAAEFMHISDPEARQWICARIEQTRAQLNPDIAERKRILAMLIAAEGIERYLHRRYVGHKRFSLEGGESLLAMLDDLVAGAAGKGVEELVIGMAHRGRLNVLVNIFGKSPADLFEEFEGRPSPNLPAVSAGDVKYHLGFSSDVETPHGPIHLVLAFNPSHLEIIDPVVEGSVRARQDWRGPAGRRGVLPVLIHGDASFAGQGVVMETLNMSETRGFGTGGTIHIVVNNQIGFTTSNPQDARSTLYCTDIAKMIDAPVLHVNGDDPEAALFAIRLAFDYRMRFQRDVFIDLLCYRRHGHNEADEPAVTQPLMYQFIRKHPTVTSLYSKRLIDAGVLTREEMESMGSEYDAALDRGKPVSRPLIADHPNPRKISWYRYYGQHWTAAAETAVPANRIGALAHAMLDIPREFALHPRVAQVVETRKKMADGALPLDWGFGETMAYASLLAEGFHVRLTGQDVRRGTFFHRHTVLHDIRNGEELVPLARLATGNGRFDVYDSLLSEEAVLGFEYGYSTSDPDALVIWEAQFGDFANGAQVVIDQFIASSEAKWGRLSGLTLLLPHGYEGQGAEHSSARLERYLQLCAEENMQVCVPTTPAQIFHLLRRQALRPYRKPLIVLTPKSLLRHKLAVSALAELSAGGYRTLIEEIDPIDPAAVTRVIICSGKVYYDLLDQRRRRGIGHIAILRIEQIYPFPGDLLTAELARYPNAQQLVWCQEEPKNQGAWRQIKHRLVKAAGGRALGYAGRPTSATPATGYAHVHAAQQEALIDKALGSTRLEDATQTGVEHED